MLVRMITLFVVNLIKYLVSVKDHTGPKHITFSVRLACKGKYGDATPQGLVSDNIMCEGRLDLSRSCYALGEERQVGKVRAHLLEIVFREFGGMHRVLGGTYIAI